MNVGRRRVSMEVAKGLLVDAGYADVGSFVNSGNLIFSGDGSAESHEAAIRSALEREYNFEITTFVRSAAQLRTLASATPFGELAAGHTHFVLFPFVPLTAAQKRAVEQLSNEQDKVVVAGRDLHWLIRAKSTETSLGPTVWKRALPDIPTTARNTTMLRKLVTKL